MSILNDTKKLLGLSEDYDVFDTDIVIHINSVFMALNQLGVGPKDCFQITGDTETWEQFTEGKLDINAVKTYVYLKVRLIFDTPSNSFTISAIENQAKEYEWRLKTQVELRNVVSPKDMEVMTKEDIDNLFNHSTTTSGEPLPDEIESLSKSDIDAMFNKKPDESAPDSRAMTFADIDKLFTRRK